MFRFWSARGCARARFAAITLAAFVFAPDLAKATTTDYNFTFSGTGFSASGTLTVDDSTLQVVALANGLVNSNAASLNTSGSILTNPGNVAAGTQPTLNSTTTLQHLFSSDGALSLVFSTSAGYFDFSYNGFNDQVNKYASNGAFFGSGTLNETFAAAGVPAPIPGAGLLSWLAFGAGALIAGLRTAAARRAAWAARMWLRGDKARPARARA